MATRINRPANISSIISDSNIKAPLEIDGEQVGWLILGIVTTMQTPGKPLTQHMFGVECLCGYKPSMTIVDIQLKDLGATERNMRTHLSEDCVVHNPTLR